MKVVAANVLVLATPLYVDGMTGPLKMVVDRMIPLGEPKIEYREDHCRHSGRGPLSDRKVVLVSNCGFWEMDSFNALVTHVKAIAKNLNAAFAGANQQIAKQVRRVAGAGTDGYASERARARMDRLSS